MNDHIRNLVVKYLQGELTEAENLELQHWIHSTEKNRIAFDEATDLEQIKVELEAELFLERKFLERLKSEIAISEEKVISIQRYRWYKYAVVAATIMLLISAGVYLWSGKKTENDTVNNEEVKGRFKNDIMPGSQKATLTLADGSVIPLDSSGKGLLATQGITAITNTDGELVYSMKNGNVGNSATLKNTVNTQNGGEYKLTLGDGTKIWLNAASSLTFPVAFTGNERKVEVTGEVYFEIAKDASKPFKVQRAGTDLEIIVLGTKYNVQAYDGEPARVTLLEGSVKVSQTGKNNSKILSPGEQAQVSESEIKLNSNPDLEEVMAWKNGIFLLNGKNLREILLQVERWYNVEIKYQIETTVKFRGRISKAEPLSKLLMILEMTNEVDFSIEGRNITVMPGKKN